MLIETPGAGGPRPRFSVVAACFNVGAYVDDFCDSLERQAIGSEDLEIIAVDDGSTDDTVERIRRCAQRSRFRWLLRSQPNSGQGAARNVGLDCVTGEWVTFVDPDDWIADDYFALVVRFIGEFPTVELVAGARVPMYEEHGGLRRGSHPLDAMFRTDALVDLNRYPDYFHGSAPAAFLRADRLQRDGLRFHPVLRPNFEDAHLIARYLLACPTPLVGFVGSARYFYRRRGDGSSSTQMSHTYDSRFAVVPRYGILDLLLHAQSVADTVPFWVQNLVLYELSYYFSESDERGDDPDYACRDRVADEFIETLGQIASMLSPDMVRGFRIRRFDPVWRDILLHSLPATGWYTPYAVVSSTADRDATVRIRYAGARPIVEVLSGGNPTGRAPVDRPIVVFGRPLLSEFAVSVASNLEVRVLVDGRHLPLRADWEPQQPNAMIPADRGRRSLRARRSRTEDGPPVARSLRAARFRRFRRDFRWRARRKARHLRGMLRRR